MIWALRVEDGHERDEQVCCGGKPNPPNYGPEDGVVDIEEIYQKAGEEGE